MKNLKGKTHNVNLAPQKENKSLVKITKALEFIGKPFYKVISIIILLVLIVSYILGKSARVIATSLLKRVIFIVQSLLPKRKRVKIVVKKTPPTDVLKRRAALIFLILKIRLIKLSQVKIRLPLPKITFKKLLGIALLILIFLPFIFFGIIFYRLPSPKDLTTRKIDISTKIYDRNGILLYKIYKDKNRTMVDLDTIPLHVRYATLAAEDAEFYVHPGFSLRGIVRAIYKNISEDKLSGGSTITQQLVKNALLTPEKTLTRKIKEIILSVMVEIRFTKNEILEMYFNEVSYGGIAYGIQEASYIYFNKPVDKLSLAEAALLGGLPKSPTKYSPFGSNPKLAKERQKEVLRLMRINKFITKDQEEKAFNQEIVFAQNRTNIKAPHFVMYVRQFLENEYGNEVVETGGLEIMTTLDYSIQMLAEKVVLEEIESLSGLNVTNGAVVVLNPKTGEILAMVGSKNYFDTSADGNVNVTTAERQPGSSIKVVNYTYALSNGYTPATIVSDTPVVYQIQGQPPYAPNNYDGAFRGNLTLRNAFAESRNVPAVRVLASYGVGNMIDQGEKMGITTWQDRSRYGLSLTLGGGEVTLIDLATAYSTIANSGKKPNIDPFINIVNYQGKNLYSNPCLHTQAKLGPDLVQDVAAMSSPKECPQNEVVDPRVAFLITDILSDNEARSPAFGSNSSLVIPGHEEVAVKTGTSNNLRDNLTVGYNQDYLVAVWVGNNDNSSMARVASGITGASPIFNKIMSSLVADTPSRQWEPPSGMIELSICPLTGTLACLGCPNKNEWFLEENVPSNACDPNFVKNLTDVRPEPQLLEEALSTER